jgi:RNA polymerase sigma factor (sigma-70 family)
MALFMAPGFGLECQPLKNRSSIFDRHTADAEAPATDSLPTRRSLLSRMRNLGDSESWHTFFETYWRLIYNVARKSGLSDDQAQEVVQDTVIAVARKIPGFRYDPAKGSFKHWLLLICRRRIHDHLRRVYSSRQLPRADPEEMTMATDTVPAAAPSPDNQIEENWELEWRENVFQMALTRVRQHANPKHYQVFDCCVLQNLRPAEVASMLGLSTAQVYLAKHRVSAAVKRAAREIETELSSTRSANDFAQ